MFKPAEDISEEFNQLALEFERNGWVANRGQNKILLYQYLSDQLPSRGELALEIGSGLGSFTTSLAEHFDRIIALDLSPEMVRVARKNTHEFTNIEFIIADVNMWDFPAGQFDCVVSITTLHHMPLEPILKKISAALKPGGILLVGDFFESRVTHDNINRILANGKKRLRKIFKFNSQSRPASSAHWEHDPNERYLPMEEVRRICDSMLPGAKVVEHLKHYSIVWKKS